MIPEPYVSEGRRLVSAPLDDDRRWELGDLAVSLVDDVLCGRELSPRERGVEASFILQEFASLLPDHVRPEHQLRYQVLRGCYEQARKVPPSMRVEGRSFNDHKPARADHLASDDVRRMFIEKELLGGESDTEVPAKLVPLIRQIERLLSHRDIDAALDTYAKLASKKDRRRLAQLRRERQEALKEAARLHAQAEAADDRPQPLMDALAKLVDARTLVHLAEMAIGQNEPAPIVAAEMKEKLVRLATAMIPINDVLQPIIHGRAPTPDPHSDKERESQRELPPGA